MSAALWGVSKVYETSNREKVVALDDVDLSVEDREFLVVLGLSGSGKTTLLRCVAGL